MQTYKFYTKKNERLAIFLNEKELVVFKCSLQDNFSKKVAREAFAEYLRNKIEGTGCKYNPKVIPLEKELSGKEFYIHCKENFRQIKTSPLPGKGKFFIRNGLLNQLVNR